MNLKGRDNYGKPKMLYAIKVYNMTDAELLKETEQKIWLSAYAANNPRSDYHWNVDVCYDEWQRRSKPEMYDKAYRQACASAGVGV